MFDQQSWEERYQAHPKIWSGRPNAALVAPVEHLLPGTALDVGCGEGGDALWLAGRGWQVTALDFATTALERGRERASELGIADRITWTHADLTRWAPEDERFDLVTAMFVHLPGESMTTLVPRLAEAVAPGGTLVLAGHDPHDEHMAAHRPDVPGMFFTAAELVALLDTDAWDVVAAESRPRAPGGHEPTDRPVNDVVVVVRRK
jgi:2-polyprenyl-3-methyl-5-hydroxy-6-metoxy-1,4-benzoquinol methylase